MVNLQTSNNTFTTNALNNAGSMKNLIARTVNKGTHSAKYIFAFPGMGKTKVAEKLPGYMDLDFGLMREAFKLSKDTESKLYKPFARYAKLTVLNSNLKILMNEPGLMGYFPPDKTCLYLPGSLKGIRISADKLGVDPAQVVNWICDWDKTAHKFGIPVTYLGTALDNYLK